MNNYCVVDVETTRNGPKDRDGTPFDNHNKIVLAGTKMGGKEAILSTVAPISMTNPDISLLVGHNITFDLHYLRKHGGIKDEFLRTCNLWDTQLAEYLLSAQRTSYAKLDDLSEQYGGNKKDERVTAMFAEGMGADKVPMSMLIPYLKADLENTEKVFIEQFKLAQKHDLIPLIKTQMDALLATQEMTYNGLAIDRPLLIEGGAALAMEVSELHKKIVEQAAPYVTSFNPDSPKQVSLLLFGGEEQVVENEQVGVYKNGKPKWKKKTRILKNAGLGLKPQTRPNSLGYFSTDDKVLTHLHNEHLTGSLANKLTGMLLEYRDKSKQLTTYWAGLLPLVGADGLIHHSLNHTVARTGRLSSSKPNLQNVTNGPIKEVFVSRWGHEGYVVEADFKQLEMVELAIVSGDKQLIHDIERGVDMHDALFIEMHGRKMKKEERKSFKRCSFALVYGAGAGGVAEQGGISKHEAQRFITTFYNRYPGVRDYHDSLIDMAKEYRSSGGLKDTETGLPVGEFVYTSPHSKRRYWFREYPTEWGSINFSPTELKNYMVQGGATGDKVPLCIGKLYRVLKNHPRLADRCLMVNTVHDSVMFDVHRDVVDEALVVIKETMERTPEFYAEAFGYVMPLPLKVELSMGPNWLDQIEVDMTETMKEAA